MGGQGLRMKCGQSGPAVLVEKFVRTSPLQSSGNTCRSSHELRYEAPQTGSANTAGGWCSCVAKFVRTSPFRSPRGRLSKFSRTSLQGAVLAASRFSIVWCDFRKFRVRSLFCDDLCVSLDGMVESSEPGLIGCKRVWEDLKMERRVFLDRKTGNRLPAKRAVRALSDKGARPALRAKGTFHISLGQRPS